MHRPQNIEREFTIYYSEKNGALTNSLFVDEITTDEPVDEKVIQAYLAAHPNRDIFGFYENKNNLINSDEHLKEKFCRDCYLFGFVPEDYGTTFCSNTTPYTYKLVGFLPQNTKYKALLRNLTMGGSTKATLSFVKKNIQNKCNPTTGERQP